MRSACVVFVRSMRVRTSLGLDIFFGCNLKDGRCLGICLRVRFQNSTVPKFWWGSFGVTLSGAVPSRTSSVHQLYHLRYRYTYPFLLRNCDKLNVSPPTCFGQPALLLSCAACVYSCPGTGLPFTKVHTLRLVSCESWQKPGQRSCDRMSVPTILLHSSFGHEHV